MTPRAAHFFLHGSSSDCSPQPLISLAITIEVAVTLASAMTRTTISRERFMAGRYQDP